MNGILFPGKEDGALIDIDLDNLNEEDVYNAFGVDGNEGEALNDIYLELYELIGRDGMGRDDGSGILLRVYLRGVVQGYRDYSI